MTDSPSGFSIQSLALPHEDPGELTRTLKEFTDAYPASDPIIQGLIVQAAMARVEIRRLERIRATVRTEKVRTALLFWEQGNDDQVETYLQQFNRHPPSALVGLLRSAAGCRWALAFLERLQKLLNEEGTWYSDDLIGSIQIQGLSACLDDLYYSEQAFLTTIDCLAAQPAPKKKDIDQILDPAIIPKGLQDRDVPLWPRDPVECRARLQAMLDREMPRIRLREATLRVQYEDPSRAEARDDGAGGGHQGRDTIAPGPAAARAVVPAGRDGALEVPQADRGIARAGGGPAYKNLRLACPPLETAAGRARPGPADRRGARGGSVRAPIPAWNDREGTSIEAPDRVHEIGHVHDRPATTVSPGMQAQAAAERPPARARKAGRKTNP